jgi:hypothetical protein
MRKPREGYPVPVGSGFELEVLRGRRAVLELFDQNGCTLARQYLSQEQVRGLALVAMYTLRVLQGEDPSAIAAEMEQPPPGEPPCGE